MTDNLSNTGNRNTGHRNTGNRNTGHRNTGDCNTGNRNTGHRNTGDWNTGDCNTGDCNTGDCNTGDWNTGDWNTGYFNTVTPENVMVFNGYVTNRKSFLEACPSWLFAPSATLWVSEENMTYAEKSENPTFHNCGGYLKTNDWHEEWQKAYATASAEDVQKVRDLPGFDAAVFQEITGLDLRIAEKAECVAQQSVVINGIRYVMEAGQ